MTPDYSGPPSGSCSTTRQSDLCRDLGSPPPSPFVARIRPDSPGFAQIRPDAPRFRAAFTVCEETPTDGHPPAHPPDRPPASPPTYRAYQLWASLGPCRECSVCSTSVCFVRSALSLFTSDIMLEILVMRHVSHENFPNMVGESRERRNNVTFRS